MPAVRGGTMPGEWAQMVEGSTVWGDVNTSANHTVWSNTMPTAQRGAARCQAKGRCIGPRDAGRDSTGLCIGHAV